MTCSSSRRCLVVLWMLSCVAAALSWWPAANDVRTEDHNGDGRPDVWRSYDRRGQLTAVAVDTNFDGRSDIHEYYDGGALVRRDSDRDFNDRVDLVEEFNPATREHVRSLVDVDDNGTADLLVLFQQGQPVFSEWAPPNIAAGRGARSSTSAIHRSGDAQLVPLEDPFRGDVALRALQVGVGPGALIGLSTSGGLPTSCPDSATVLAPATGVVACGTSDLSAAALLPHSPRGPPVSRLFA